MPVPGPVARGVDAVLEATVVGGFSAIGYRWRERAFAWGAAAGRSGPAPVVLVTGPTSGLGRAGAFRLAALGCRIIAVGRNPTRLDALATALRETHPEVEVETHVADLADLATVAAAAREIRGRGTLDALIHNAGSLDHHLQITPQGLERTFQTHVVAPHLLTRLLLPDLGTRGRVVVVSSGGMYTQSLPTDPVRVPSAGEYDGVRAYAWAKRAQVVLTEQWGRRYPLGPQVHAMHPGWADTPGVADSLPGFHRLMRPVLRTPEQGADTAVWLATTDADLGPSGGFWLDRRRRGTTRLPGTATSARDAARLWERVQGLTDPFTVG